MGRGHHQFDVWQDALSPARGSVSEIETRLLITTWLGLAPASEALETQVGSVFARLNASIKRSSQPSQQA